MNDTLYEKEIRRLESIVHGQNEIIDQQYTTILQLESKLREYEHMEKVKRSQTILKKCDILVAKKRNSYELQLDNQFKSAKITLKEENKMNAEGKVDFEKNFKLESASKELIYWLSKYGDPYTTITVSQDRITVTQDEIGIPVKE